MYLPNQNSKKFIVISVPKMFSCFDNSLIFTCLGDTYIVSKIAKNQNKLGYKILTCLKYDFIKHMVFIQRKIQNS